MGRGSTAAAPAAAPAAAAQGAPAPSAGLEPKAPPASYSDPLANAIDHTRPSATEPPAPPPPAPPPAEPAPPSEEPELPAPPSPPLSPPDDDDPFGALAAALDAEEVASPPYAPSRKSTHAKDPSTFTRKRNSAREISRKITRDLSRVSVASAKSVVWKWWHRKTRGNGSDEKMPCWKQYFVLFVGTIAVTACTITVRTGAAHHARGSHSQCTLRAPCCAHHR